MWVDTLRAAVGRALERGRPGSTMDRAAEALWSSASARGLQRPLRLPAGAAVIGVGGATLGGAGKTPLCVELARALAEGGAKVAVVGHAYRARPGRAQVVRPTDPVATVGDDALYAAGALASIGVPVVVAASRQDAVDRAARLADVLLVDGLLQARPRRLAASLLVVDAVTPATARCPPLGDLRAPWSALRAAADVVVRVVAEDAVETAEGLGAEAPALLARSQTSTVELEGREVPLAALGTARVGLLVAVAHPERIERTLLRAGIVPRRVVALADHARLRCDRIAAGDVDLWLTTARCRTKLPARVAGAPVATLVHRVDAAAVVDWLEPRLGGAVRARRGDASLPGSG
ncbi:MAG: tetraacyldisaccharide 4'-kinase [Polyangiaceae bacterium]